jgi:Tfp pilus assembly ATPase PilU
VNAFRQRGSVSIVMRFIPFGVPTFEDLGLPEGVATLAREERGSVLVTGTTGSGKSTTLASMPDLVNRTVPKHIDTIEDSIEFLHREGVEFSVLTSSGTSPDASSDQSGWARTSKRIARYTSYRSSEARASKTSGVARS